MAWYDPTSWDWGAIADWGKQKADYSQAQMQDRGRIGQVINQGLGRVDARQAPQVASQTIATGPQDQFRAAQLGQMRRLQGIASGQQQGAGELAAQRQAQQAIAAQQAAARMSRAGGGAAQLGAARNMVDISGAAAGQARQAALQDQMSAQGMLTQAMGQGRGQDIGLATDQANLRNAAGLANLQAQLQARGMNDAAINNYLQALLGMNQAEMNARVGLQGAEMGQAGLLGGALSAAGTVAAGYASRP